MVSSTMPPVSLCRSAESVELYSESDESDEGVIRSRNASAPGPENSCCSLSRNVSCH
jgi:hypothetical protein